MCTVCAVIALVLPVPAAPAQPLAPGPLPPASPPAPGALPPGQAVPNESPFLLPGKEVSRPLTPVGPAPPLVPESAPQPTPEPTPADPPPRGPLGPSWSSAELLFWWPRPQPVPPLVAGTRSGLPPAPGDPGTALLIGGRSLGSEPHAGGRFTVGNALNHAETFGYEITYLFLGTRTLTGRVADGPTSRVQAFGLPYTNADTGAAEFLPLAQPGASSARLTAAVSTRLQGWEVNAVANLFDGASVKLNALAGWRYFQVHEGLRLEQTQTQFGDRAGVVRTADQFDAHNRFHGGQLGLHADARRGIVFCELTAKVAFGQNYEVVKAEGMTLLSSGSAFGGSGLYVQPSNSGRTAGGVFAVLPEGTVKFGLRLGEASRVYVGYSFLYLSDAVRPGDQIDRTLAPGRLPLVSGAGPVYTADRPARVVNRSDFWTQGLVIGLQARY